jgi:SAM-dependent methyltransferase
MSEIFHYARLPIRTFLDIGSGPGYFLDAVAKYLPNSTDIFHAVEKFPPPPEYRTKSTNYFIGDIADFPQKVDGGLCMEVIEHMNPSTVQGLFQSLANISEKDAIYIFNTGMPDYVRNEDQNYIDPIIRGHIVSYSVKAVEILAKPFGFSVLAIPGKTWAFVLEYNAVARPDEDIRDRIWTAHQENINVLTDKDMGSALRILGMETARAY